MPARIMKFIFVLFLLLLPVQTLHAATTSTTKVAVIDIQKLMNASKVAQNIQDQLEKERGNFQAEFKRREDKLRDTEQKLGAQRETLSEDEFEAQRRQFEEEVLTTRKMVQTRRRALESAASKALIKVRAEILQIVADIANDDNYDLVIGRDNVILASRAMDITDQVMTQLDKNIKSVKLEIDNSN